MTGLVNEINRRNEQEENGDFSWQRKPIFVFIDELPEVFARCPKAVELLDQIGRMGNQFCVFSWIVGQTAVVSDIGLSTAAQAQYGTRIYGGGDRTSSSRLMKCTIPMESERTLQANKGLTLILAEGIEELQFVRAPLVTNEALFAYLKEPAFRKEDWTGGRKARTSPSEQIAQYPSLSFSSERWNPSTFHAQHETMKEGENENENIVKGPLRLYENDESFIASHEDEIAVLMAVVQLQSEGVKVTREAIKQKLGWNNAKHPELKAVCDKHKIAVR